MSWEIVQQPRKRGDREFKYARFTTVTMSNTHVDLPSYEMIIRLVRGGYCTADEARRMVYNAAPAKRGKTPYQSGNL